jgi:hypothetical protein
LFPFFTFKPESNSLEEQSNTLRFELLERSRSVKLLLPQDNEESTPLLLRSREEILLKKQDSFSSFVLLLSIKDESWLELQNKPVRSLFLVTSKILIRFELQESFLRLMDCEVFKLVISNELRFNSVNPETPSDEVTEIMTSEDLETDRSNFSLPGKLIVCVTMPAAVASQINGCPLLTTFDGAQAELLEVVVILMICAERVKLKRINKKDNTLTTIKNFRVVKCKEIQLF